MSRSKPRRTLRVLSEDAGVQITILNQTLEPVAQGIQNLEVKLPPGLYEARFEAGSSVREQLVELDPGSEPMDVHQAQIAFATAAPLTHTRRQIPEQSEAATRISNRVHRELGRGGQLLVFVRDDDLRARSSPARGLTLHSLDGETVGELEADGESGGGSGGAHPPWAGCTYRLKPGPWRLRCQVPGAGVFEQTVVVSSRWQTQVFLQRRRLRSGGSRWPDLADASILMARMGTGFSPDLAEQRATELARQGLRDRRSVVAANDLRAMLYGKKKNPMLAIYGAHLMMQDEKPDRQFLTSVAKKLRDLVGSHPDVMALVLWLDPDADVGDFAAPPMLWSSWSVVVDATAKRPELIPRGSLSAAIAERLLAGGPWLRWRVAPGVDTGSVRAAPEVPVALGKTIANIAEALPADPKVTWEQSSDASFTESEVISFATQIGKRAAHTSDTDVVKRLGMPRTVAEDAISSVVERLGS